MGGPNIRVSDPILSIRSSSSVGDAPAATEVRKPEAAPPADNPAAAPDKLLLPFEDRKRHLLWIWIPVVIGLGLLVATGYVGGRILTSKSSASSSAQTATTVAQSTTTAPSTPAPATPSSLASKDTAAQNSSSPDLIKTGVTAVAPAANNSTPAQSIEPVQSNSETADAPADLNLITPQPGERYIQISALNTEAARRYVEELRHGPLEPHLAPGPRPNLLRVLIGPFKDTSLLLTTRSDLLSAGIDCFIREY